MIDRNLDLIHVCREADHFLKFPTGRRASLNLIDMLPEGLRAMVGTAVHRTIREHTAVSYRDIPYRRGSATEYVTLTVKPVEEIARDATGHFLLVFDSTVLGREQPAPERKEGQLQADQGTMIADLERELQYTKETLQATIEELETSNEELQANNDMKNFLDNTDIGMIFTFLDITEINVLKNGSDKSGICSCGYSNTALRGRPWLTKLAVWSLRISGRRSSSGSVEGNC